MPSPYCVSHYRSARTPLRQCELLSAVHRVLIVPASLGTTAMTLETVTVEYAVVVTQDCDLEQDHGVRFINPKPESDKLVPSVMLAVVRPAADIFATIADSNKKNWERLKIETNKNERFHFLQKVERADDRGGTGLPELAIDFKRYFSLPTDELYRRLELGETQRRCVLVSPYLEHLSTRFAGYLCRVALPADHASD